jgi:hypothetical protein
MRCRGLHGLGKRAYLGCFLFPRLPRVAPYCVPGGVRVVSMQPLYLHNIAVYVKFLSVHIG